MVVQTIAFVVGDGMKKTTFRFTCEYNGAPFHGFQRQANAPTVQAELELVLFKYFNQKITLYASGRTDAGVHARGQVCSFVADGVHSEMFKIASAVNSFLPPSVATRDWQIVPPDFNARFDTKAKTYSYKTYINRHRSPLSDPYALQLYTVPDVGAMRGATKCLVGEHDFSAFTTVKNEKENRVRTVYSLEINCNENEIVFFVRGNGFLKNMVRIVVGTLLDVGYGKLTAADMPRILESRDRTLAGKTAPAHGLCLESVEY